MVFTRELENKMRIMKIKLVSIITGELETVTKVSKNDRKKRKSKAKMKHHY